MRAQIFVCIYVNVFLFFFISCILFFFPFLILGCCYAASYQFTNLPYYDGLTLHQLKMYFFIIIMQKATNPQAYLKYKAFQAALTQ